MLMIYGIMALEIPVHPFVRLERAIRQVAEHSVKTSRPQDFGKCIVPVKRIDPVPVVHRGKCDRFIRSNIPCNKGIPAQDIPVERLEHRSCETREFFRQALGLFIPAELEKEEHLCHSNGMRIEINTMDGGTEVLLPLGKRVPATA